MEPMEFIILSNGFKFDFAVSLDPDSHLLLQERVGKLGQWKAKDSNLLSLDDYLDNTNITADNIDHIQALITNRLDNIAAQYITWASHGILWNYWRLDCWVYLDIPKYKDLNLFTEFVTGLEEPADIKDIAQQFIKDVLLAKSFKTLIELQASVDLGDLVIGFDHEASKAHSLQYLYDYLSDSTLLVMNEPEQISAHSIREWVEGTKGQLDDPSNTFNSISLLDEIYNRAYDLAEFVHTKIQI